MGNLQDRSDTVCVIGGGWFGCYAAFRLQQMGIKYTLIESEKELFSGASGNNQNRLHQGWHYPRSYATRKMSYDGFRKFQHAFPTLSTEVTRNVYCIAEDSLLDFETYESIFRSEQYDYDIVELQGFRGINRFGFMVSERMIEVAKSRRFFSALIRELDLGNRVHSVSDNIVIDQKYGETKYRYVIDCTYGSLKKMEGFIEQKYLVVCLEPITAKLSFGAVTVMDGPFFSVFPCAERKYTLTSVMLGPLPERNANSGNVDLQKLEHNIFREACEYFPKLAEEFTVSGSFIATKYKSEARSDRRSTILEIGNKITHVYSGKIDNIFELEKVVVQFK